MTEIQAGKAGAPTLPLALPRPMLLGVLGLTLAIMSVAGCNRSKGDAEPTANSAAAMERPAVAASTKYTCPMHPEVVSDKPGKCPQCGMDLVPGGQHQGHMMEHNH